MLQLLGMGMLDQPAATSELYTVDCALRAWAHFNPAHGYHAEGFCLKCNRQLRRTDDIGVVMLAVPPWDGKTLSSEVALAVGLFCASCDPLDVEAMAIWCKYLKADCGIDAMFIEMSANPS
jgi:hypothetical protein